MLMKSLGCSVEFSCPHCMQCNDIAVNREDDLNHEQIVECQSCRRPIEVVVTLGLHDKFNVIASAQDD
jgi:Zn ribbon nucleic-acid-binding protein